MGRRRPCLGPWKAAPPRPEQGLLGDKGRALASGDNICSLIISQDLDWRISSKITLLGEERLSEALGVKEWSLGAKIVHVFLWDHLFIQQTVMGRMLGTGKTVTKRDTPRALAEPTSSDGKQTRVEIKHLVCQMAIT